MEWMDISMPLHSGMLVWPGDAGARVEQTMFLERGDPYNLTHLNFCAHTGTHVDAPRHFLRDGADMASMRLDAFLGEARVIDVDDDVAVRAHHVPVDLAPGERLLFRTRNSREYLRLGRFVEEFVYVSKEASAAMATAQVSVVGIDYLSVGGFHTDLVETHEILLGAGIWVVEGLDLSRVPAGRYELACLPLLIPGADGAPARALVRPLRRRDAAE